MTTIAPPSAEPPDRIATVRASTGRVSQVVTLVAVVVPALGLFSAMGLLWGVAFHWVDLALFLGLGLVITGATLLFLSTIRSERQLMTDRYDEMARLLSRNLSRLQFSTNGHSASSNSQVVALSSGRVPSTQNASPSARRSRRSVRAVLRARRRRAGGRRRALPHVRPVGRSLGHAT